MLTIDAKFEFSAIKDEVNNRLYFLKLIFSSFTKVNNGNSSRRPRSSLWIRNGKKDYQDYLNDEEEIHRNLKNDDRIRSNQHTFDRKNPTPNLDHRIYDAQ